MFEMEEERDSLLKNSLSSAFLFLSMSSSLREAVSALIRICTPVSLMKLSLYSSRKGNFLFRASRSRLLMPEGVEAGSLTLEEAGLDLTVSSVIRSLAAARLEESSSPSRVMGKPKQKKKRS